MILYAEDRLAAMPESFERLVVEIDVGQLDIARFEGIGIDREAVIVGRDLHFVGDLVEHRMVRAAVPEFELVGLAAQGKAEDLLAQADSENRLPADELLDFTDLIFERLGIARTVREEDSVGLESQDVFSGSG